MIGKTNILRYGKETPLPEQIPLRAGMLTMVYEDGDLRSIKYGEHEMVAGSIVPSETEIGVRCCRSFRMCRWISVRILSTLVTVWRTKRMRLPLPGRVNHW